MKLQFSDYEKNDYRLTGIGSSILSPIAFCIGSRNVVGGHACRFSAFDRAARKLTLSEGEIGKFAAGMRLYLWSTAYDENSPYEIKIIAVDANAITLENDLAVTDEHVTRLAEWVGAVRDVNREAAAFAAGDLCFAVGDYATATGTLTLATGFAATAAGALSEARGDYAIAAGDATVAEGIAAVAVGTQTVARGHAAMATGCATKAVNDNTFTAGIGTEATGDGAAAVGQRTKASGRAAFAGGQMAEAAGDYSAAFGNQVKTAAKHSMLTGRHGELADTPENDGAFAVAAGAVKAPHLALKVFGNRSVKNPLYGQEGEREYIPEPDAGIEVGGHILAGTVIVSGAVLQLDHGRAGRWKITPGTTVTPTLKNWRDGDVGELVIYNGGSKVNFPAAWKWVGTIPTLKTAGVDVFTIRQIDNIIFIKHEVTA